MYKLTHFAQVSFFDTHGTAGGKSSHRPWHRRLAFFLLQAIPNNQKGSRTNIHPFRCQDNLDGSSHGKQIEDDLSHSKVKTFLKGIKLNLSRLPFIMRFEYKISYLSDKLDDFDENIKRCIPRDNRF